MKKIMFKKESMIQTTLVACVMMVVSCNYSPNPLENKLALADQTNERMDDKKMKEDTKFLEEAANFNLGEIQLGRMAQRKGHSVRVKELGKKMDEAHTRSQKDLSALAKRRMITIPTSLPNDTFDKLNKKSGEDFDDSYLDMTIKNHKDIIEKFENVSTDSDDKEIKEWAIAALPNLRTHLNHAIEVQKRSDKK